LLGRDRDLATTLEAERFVARLHALRKWCNDYLGLACSALDACC
jgi:hypothetical protein